MRNGRPCYAGAPVVLDAALVSPERCPALILVAPAVFVGEPPSKDKDGGASGGGGGGGGGGLKLPLDRALRFAWFRFLISQDAPGLNVVRGSVYRQTAAIEEGRMYADLAPEAGVRPITFVYSLCRPITFVCSLCRPITFVYSLNSRLNCGYTPCSTWSAIGDERHETASSCRL